MLGCQELKSFKLQKLSAANIDLTPFPPNPEISLHSPVPLIFFIDFTRLVLEQSIAMAGVPLLKEESLASGSEDGYYRPDDLLTDGRTRKPLFRAANIGWAVLCACLLGLTIGISAGVAYLVVQGWSSQASTCIAKTSAASPVTRDLDITYHTQQFNGSFMVENIYRQSASPEVDAAWDALGVNC
jgi:hypothetical protein